MQPEASEHSHPALTPVTDLLGRVSGELEDIAAAVERMYPLVSAQNAQAAMPADPAYVQALQGFDLIEQQLRGLAGFLANLKKVAAPEWQLDPRMALAAVTLSDLASRLAGREPMPPAQDTSCFGDFEFL